MSVESFCRPLCGLPISYLSGFPAINRWAILDRPLRGLACACFHEILYSLQDPNLSLRRRNGSRRSLSTEPRLPHAALYPRVNIAAHLGRNFVTGVIAAKFDILRALP